MKTDKDFAGISRTKKELINYIFWGIISTALNIGFFQLLLLLKADYRIANIITLIFIKIFCYVTNKLFVFRSKCDGFVELLKEMGSFFCARLITFLIDYFGVVILVEFIKLDAFWSKVIMAGVVIFANYIFSEKMVFKR